MNSSQMADISFSDVRCFENLSSGIFIVDTDGEILFINREAERLLGVERQKYIGTRLPSLISELTDDKGVPISNWQQELDKVSATRETQNYPVMGLRTPEQLQLSWIKLSVSCYETSASQLTYVVFSLTDVSELKQQAHQATLHAEVFEASGEAIVITDDSLRVLDVNDSFCYLTGEDRNKVIDRKANLVDMIREDPKIFYDYQQQLEQNNSWQGEIWYHSKSGKIPVLLSVSKIVHDKSTRSYHLVFIFTDITELKLARERLDFLAYHDQLTRLPNRSMCQLRFQHSIDRVSRNGKSVALLFLDLDDFKTINDSLGHSRGDLLLKQLADRLKETVRKNDTVARLGGDEFLLILEDIDDHKQIEKIAKKILEVLEQPYELGKCQRYITGSLGIAIYPIHGRTFDELLKNADAALHSSKSTDRNNFRLYQAELSEQLSRRAQLEHDLRNALIKHSFELFFQPQMNLKTGSISGAEALLRWNHPNGELVSPAEFIPIIEHTGLIVPIGRWVVRDALLKLKTWREQGIHLPRVAVNVSAIQLHKDQLIDYLRELLDELEMTPSDLEIEITESVFVDNQVIPKVLQKLHEQGYYLALDDFGTGYSSLSYLTRLPFNKIKLDRSFVAKIETDADSRAMAKSLVALAKTLGFEVTAEGVENIAQLYFLLEQGCDQVQGYYIGKPVPTDLFVKDVKTFEHRDLLQKIKGKAI